MAFNSIKSEEAFWDEKDGETRRCASSVQEKQPFLETPSVTRSDDFF